MRFEEEDVAVEDLAFDDARTRRGVDRKAEGTDGDFAIVADEDRGSEAPDEAPPRAGGSWPDDGVILLQRGLVSGLWSGADFAMEFVSVGVVKERLEQGVCRLDDADGIGCEDGWEPFLPVVVAAFDFAFCLRSGSVAEGDAVKLEGGTELSESVWRVGEKERVIIDVKSQRQTVREKGRGEEIQMSGERLGAVKAGTSIEARGIVENVEEHLFILAAREESVRRRIVLPECAEITNRQRRTGFAGDLKRVSGARL